MNDLLNRLRVLSGLEPLVEAASTEVQPVAESESVIEPVDAEVSADKIVGRILHGNQRYMEEGYDEDDRWDGYDEDEDEFDREQFANPGSALRASSEKNPRNLPCPRCRRPNRLTPADKARGYQCDACATRAEGGHVRGEDY